MNDRIPCGICETPILPITAKTHAGLCGQCLRDPAGATKRAARKRTIRGWGQRSPEAVRHRLSEACQASAIEAAERFSNETIYGFYLYLDPCWQFISGVRIFTEEWARSKTSTGRWTPLYTEETCDYVVGAEAMKTVSEFAAHHTPGSNCFHDCLHALRSLRDSSVFAGRVVLGASSGDESPEEAVAFVELTNRKDVSDWYASTISYDQTLLELQRRRYREEIQEA